MTRICKILSFPRETESPSRLRAWPSNPLLCVWVTPSFRLCLWVLWGKCLHSEKSRPVVRAACFRITYAMTIARRSWLVDLEVGLCRRLMTMDIYLNFTFHYTNTFLANYYIIKFPTLLKGEQHR